jgi:hypothetical protein
MLAKELGAVCDLRNAALKTENPRKLGSRCIRNTLLESGLVTSAIPAESTGPTILFPMTLLAMPNAPGIPSAKVGVLAVAETTEFPGPVVMNPLMSCGVGTLVIASVDNPAEENVLTMLSAELITETGSIWPNTTPECRYRDVGRRTGMLAITALELISIRVTTSASVPDTHAIPLWFALARIIPCNPRLPGMPVMVFWIVNVFERVSTEMTETELSAEFDTKARSPSQTTE